MLYWCLLLLMLVLAGLNNVEFCYNSKIRIAIPGKIVYIFFCGALLVMLAGLRSIKVGNDTAMYKILFDYMGDFSTFPDALQSWKLGGVEIGYAFIEYIFSHTATFQFFLFFTAGVSIIPVLVVIYKYSENIWLSLFFYIAFGYFAFAMNGIRQSIAIGICMIALIAAINRKIVQFLILVCIAFLFHRTAILFLPVYWFNKIIISKKTAYIYITILGSLFAFKQYLFHFLNSFSRQSFGSVNDAGGIRMFLFMLFILILLWVYKDKFLDVNKTNRIFFTLYSVSVLMWPVASLNGELFRMYYYYQIFIMMVLPSLIVHVDKYAKLIFSMIFIAISCYYLQSYIINGQLSYAPYYFYWK